MPQLSSAVLPESWAIEEATIRETLLKICVSLANHGWDHSHALVFIMPTWKRYFVLLLLDHFISSMHFVCVLSLCPWTASSMFLRGQIAALYDAAWKAEREEAISLHSQGLSKAGFFMLCSVGRGHFEKVIIITIYFLSSAFLISHSLLCLVC